MTQAPTGFVPIKQVARDFATSRSTVDRRRVKAQRAEDSATLRNFMLRTRDGRIHEAPSPERVQQLIKSGQVPEWFVNRTWLKKEYGRRETGENPHSEQSESRREPPAAGDEVVAALRRQFQERISDLKQQLQQEQAEKRRLLEYAQADKQLFGSAVANLTKVLTLPGMAAAIETANHQLSDTATSTSRGETSPETTPNSQSSAKPKSSPGRQPSPKPRRWFRRRRS